MKINTIIYFLKIPPGDIVVDSDANNRCPSGKIILIPILYVSILK